ncbi:melanocortin receptor 3-like [Ostrea edulis]|uniref:melanocortin receptor 3-like n=1 Tax=Ostrea edulis TaxID=37623 RepID=UPI002094EEC7|nr:melanocortin receptor 3-like [Ostrea edulis]
MQTNMEMNTTKGSTFVLQQDALPFLIGVLITLVNLLALFILAQIKKMSLQIKMLSMNLAVTDLLTGVAVLGDSCLSPILPESLCRPLMYLYCLGVVVSFLNITGMLFDRFCALFFPFKYHNFLEKKTCLFIIASLWFCGCLLTVVNFHDGFRIYDIQDLQVCASYIMVGKTGLAIVTFLFCIFMILNIVLYILMFMKMYKLSYSVHTADSLNRQRHFKSQAKILINLSAITGAFMVLYTPMIVMSMIDIFDKNPAMKKTILMLQSRFGVLVLLNSFVNPFLFVWRFLECRYTFLLMVCYCNKTKREYYRDFKKTQCVSFLDVPMRSS